MNNQMVVVSHDGVGADINAIDLRKCQHLSFNPVPSMLITLLGNGVFPTEKTSSDTARDAMIIGCSIDTQLVFSSGCHSFVQAVNSPLRLRKTLIRSNLE